jgi:hypothetical protein
MKRRRKKMKANRHAGSNRVTFSKLTLHKLDWLEWVTILLAGWFFFISAAL